MAVTTYAAENNMQNSNDKCRCVAGLCVGYGYVPPQTLGETYCVDDAIMNGTVFPELDLSIAEYGKVCKDNGGVANGK